MGADSHPRGLRVSDPLSGVGWTGKARGKSSSAAPSRRRPTLVPMHSSPLPKDGFPFTAAHRLPPHPHPSSVPTAVPFPAARQWAAPGVPEPVGERGCPESRCLPRPRAPSRSVPWRDGPLPLRARHSPGMWMCHWLAWDGWTQGPGTVRLPSEKPDSDLGAWNEPSQVTEQAAALALCSRLLPGFCLRPRGSQVSSWFGTGLSCPWSALLVQARGILTPAPTYIPLVISRNL